LQRGRVRPRGCGGVLLVGWDERGNRCFHPGNARSRRAQACTTVAARGIGKGLSC
jgi:hypothetical protein